MHNFPNLSEACRSLLNKILDTVFTALQTVVEGKRLDLQPLSGLLQYSVEFIPNKSDHPFVKSLLEVSLRNVQRFWNEGQYDLQPVKDIVNEWIENASNLSETNRTYLKSLLNTSIETVRVLAEGEPLDLNPMCSVLHDWLNSSPKLSEAEVCFLKNIIDILCFGLQMCINGEYNAKTYSVPMQIFEAYSKPNNGASLAVLKYRLRKRGILVYSE